PYLNFFINPKFLADFVFKEIGNKEFGKNEMGKSKKIMVEYAQPNTHKAFHIGHLRNIITGESLARIFENSGYKVIRTNFQGDVGLHIAKCLWGIQQSMPEYEAVKKEKIQEKVLYLGRVYAKGGIAYEEDENAKKEIVEINEKIYNKDNGLFKIYKETRKWSLEYFDIIYAMVGAKFDRLYFESETFDEGKKLVMENLKKGIFKESEGAVIFEGEKYGLHNRVFLNSKGLPTYEAKDLALAEMQLKEYNPDAIFHVVGKEQTEYFKVLFKAIEQVFPQSAGKENHLMYGWVSLKEGKMSSRTGNVVLAEWLIEETKRVVADAMRDHEVNDKKKTIEKVALAAIKYSFLRTGAQNDILFDVKESINLTGDSGPYLLYIVARINSILKKAKMKFNKFELKNISEIHETEKKLLLDIANYAETARGAAVKHDPSKISHYLLNLAQDFNAFYGSCPVIKAEGDLLFFRLNLIRATAKAMTDGLNLLGIDVVGAM
ncbi:arginine--tRNA ligase, partial [Patescibacteria group bacterium]|nr:arginine--tRNA ligase [Patescibacteria group bacterium]